MTPHPHQPVRGYSLLELIVAVGIFSMVMLIVVGVYLALISYDRQARATNQLVANFSFAVESMVRNIRTGTNYTCNSTTNCTTFSFRDADGTVVAYCLQGGILGKRTGGGLTGNDCVSSSQTVPLTDPAIHIDTLRFFPRGTNPIDTTQSQVTIFIKGNMDTDAGEDVSFSIQTGATQRVLDIP